MSSREIPEITLLEVIHETASFCVERSHSYFPSKNVSPLGLGVPVQFANDSLI
jgi:hypothetical protein